jgi:hypothetical protein
MLDFSASGIFIVTPVRPRPVDASVTVPVIVPAVGVSEISAS